MHALNIANMPVLDAVSELTTLLEKWENVAKNPSTDPVVPILTRLVLIR